jgi:hypothetical protein
MLGDSQCLLGQKMNVQVGGRRNLLIETFHGTTNAGKVLVKTNELMVSSSARCCV